jgi:lysozyme family protein
MANFDDAFAFMLPHEGGYVFDTRDPGGETKYGITKKTYPQEDIAQLTVERAKEIYHRDFWNPLYDSINSQAIANKVFDLGVNMGRQTAVKLLQKACIQCGELTAADGHFGQFTLNAVNSADVVLLLTALKQEAIGHYQRLVAVNPKLAVFIVGWCKRATA